MLQKIRIKLKSYDHATLDQSAAEIVRTARRTGAITSGPVPLPTRKTVYTVLRSPHVDKKSREQFEIRIHKRLIDITRSTAQTMEALEKLDVPAGVVIETGPCTVTEVRSKERDGYVAVQLGFGTNKESRFTRPLLGQFKKRNLPP